MNRGLKLAVRLGVVVSPARINNLAPMNRGLKPVPKKGSEWFPTYINNLAPMNRGLKLVPVGDGVAVAVD